MMPYPHEHGHPGLPTPLHDPDLAVAAALDWTGRLLAVLGLLGMGVAMWGVVKISHWLWS